MNKLALAKLEKLTEARKNRDLAAVEVLLRERTQLEAEIEVLNGTSTRDAAEGNMPFTMIAQRGRWIERQVTLRQHRLDAIAAEIEHVRIAAKVSVGKHEALNKLTAHAAAEAERARNRAEELAAHAGHGVPPSGPSPEDSLND